MSDNSAAKSASRALDLFDLLDRWGRGMTHGEIADHLQIPKSSLTPLLKRLTARRYLSFAADSRTYALGGRLIELVKGSDTRRHLAAMAQPVLEHLTKVTGESSHLNVLSGGSALLVARVVGPQVLTTAFAIGNAIPLHASAGGKTILASLSNELQEEYLARALTAMTPATKVDATALRQQLKGVRADGFCIAVDELVIGVVGVAVPLSLGANIPGSVILSMPTVRYAAEEITEKIKALKSAAKNIAELVSQQDEDTDRVSAASES